MGILKHWAYESLCLDWLNKYDSTGDEVYLRLIGYAIELDEAGRW